MKTFVYNDTIIAIMLDIVRSIRKDIHRKLIEDDVEATFIFIDKVDAVKDVMKYLASNYTDVTNLIDNLSDDIIMRKDWNWMEVN